MDTLRSTWFNVETQSADLWKKHPCVYLVGLIQYYCNYLLNIIDEIEKSILGQTPHNNSAY